MPNLLVVDDEKSIQITLREILEEAGHNVFCAESYNSAISILQSQSIEIIITDIILPAKSGLDLLDFAKKHFNNIQVIVMTGEPNLNSAIHSIRSGASDYLAKPVNFDELKNSILRGYKQFLTLKLKEKLNKENQQIRKKLEQLLKEKTRSLDEIAERYKSVAMTAADAVLILDDELNIIETNIAAAEMFGYAEKEMTILNISHLIPFVNSESIQKIINSDAPNNSFTNIYALKKDSTEFPIEFSVGSWKNKNSTYYSIIIHNISKRKETEAKAQKLSQAVEQSANSIVITDTLGNIEYVNPQFEKITGYKIDEVIGKNSRILKSGEMSGEEYKILWNTITNGNEWKGEFHNRNKYGEKYWESASISPIKDKSGKIINFIAIKEDITKQKEYNRIQSALLSISNILQEEDDFKKIMSKLNNQLSILLNTDNFFIALYNAEKKSIYFPYYQDENDDYEFLPAEGTLTYYTIKIGTPQLITRKQYLELIEKKEIVPVGTPAEIWAGVPITVNDEIVGVVVTQDYENENKIGEKELQLLKFVTNQISSVIDRNMAKEALAFEKEELSVTISCLAEAVITTDMNGKITLVNQAVEKIFNVRKSMMINEQIFKFFWNSTDNGLERIKSFYRKIKIGGAHYKSEQFTVSFSHGKRKFITVSTSSLQSTDGKIKGIVFVIRDVTSKVEIENQLALSQKMESIGQLAAGIAHEINTPMQYIGDNTTFLNDSFDEILIFISKIKELVKNNSNNPLLEKIETLIEELDLDYLAEEIPESISQSQIGIEKVRKLVLAMKDFAHPGKKQKTLSDINKGIEITSVISKNEWKYVAELELKLDPNLPPVPVVLDEINQVLLNMIVNAAHAIEEKISKDKNHKGKIVISSRTGKKYIEIIITDNGIGIAKEKVNVIFDPFYTTKEVGKGTGQGLAIVHNIIVNKHFGKIRTDSNEGKGTTFVIQLPIEEKENDN